MGFTPTWLAALVIARDLAIVAGIALGHALGLPLKVEPLLIGKWSTAVQVGYVGFSLLLLAFGLHWTLFASIAACITAAITLASWFAYGSVLLNAFALRNRRAA
jgi:cardiolipin synthase